MKAKEEKSSKKSLNKMRDIQIEKLILNISVGASGDKLTKAVKVLKDLTNQTPVTSKAKYTIRAFGIKRNEEIGCHVTVRGKKAEDILKDPYDCNKCGNSFCHDCISTLLNENKPCPFKCTSYSINPSSLIVTSYLSKLKFSCRNKANGCNESISYGDLSLHDKECKYFYTVCPNKKCGKKMKWTLIESHIRNECEYSLFECPTCSMQFYRKEFQEHIKNCLNIRESLCLKKDKKCSNEEEKKESETEKKKEGFLINSIEFLIKIRNEKSKALKTPTNILTELVNNEDGIAKLESLKAVEFLLSYLNVEKQGESQEELHPTHTTKEIKAMCRPDFEREPEKYYPTTTLKKIGFHRSQCPKCKHFFWRHTDKQETCGDSNCEGKYHFIGRGTGIGRKGQKITYADAWNGTDRQNQLLDYYNEFFSKN